MSIEGWLRLTMVWFLFSAVFSGVVTTLFQLRQPMPPFNETDNNGGRVYGYFTWAGILWAVFFVVGVMFVMGLVLLNSFFDLVGVIASALPW